MNEKFQFPPILLILLSAASFVIVVAGMQYAASILNSFFLALVIAIAITPLLNWLIRKGLPPSISLLIIILLVLIGGLTLISFLGISVSQLIKILPTYEVKIAALKQSSIAFLEAKGIQISEVFSLDAFQPSKIIGIMINFLSRIANALSSSLLLLFIVIFMLIESTVFHKKLRKGLIYNTRVLDKFNEFNREIKSYVLITAWTGAITALVDFLILTFLGIDLAVLWGLLFFLFNFIPAVGFLLAVVPPALLALLEFSPQKAFLVFFLCFLVDNIMDKGIKPRYMQKGLDLSPLIVILSVIFWGWVLGPTGAILAVPVTLMIKKLVLEAYGDDNLLALLMASGQDTKQVNQVDEDV